MTYDDADRTLYCIVMVLADVSKLSDDLMQEDTNGRRPIFPHSIAKCAFVIMQLKLNNDNKPGFTLSNEPCVITLCEISR